MQIDETKNFIIMEDNDDGTVTYTINLPTINPKLSNLTLIVEMNLEDLALMMMSTFDPNSNQFKTFEDKSIIIPNVMGE